MLFLSVCIVLVSISETNTKFDTKRNIKNNEQIWKYTRMTHSFWKENEDELIFILCFFLLCLILIFLAIGCLKTKYSQILISWCYRNFFDTQVDINYPLPRDNNYWQARYRNNRIYWNDNALQYQPPEDI
ncbi:uncharacterized protein LOC126852379 isoform X2 [Cataglyphis hispanica]|nr:uncharacterized protein LOC126852379 isoform X2 [Cataglyphis hispanica]